MTGRINPRGMGADLSQGRLSVAVSGLTVLEDAALGADGLIRTDGVTASFDPEFGTISIALTGIDLGAGNAWLSYRLSLRGHRPCAVDIFTDGRDGLGAARHYPIPFPTVEADFSALPFQRPTTFSARFITAFSEE